MCGPINCVEPGDTADQEGVQPEAQAGLPDMPKYANPLGFRVSKKTLPWHIPSDDVEQDCLCNVISIVAGCNLVGSLQHTPSVQRLAPAWGCGVLGHGSRAPHRHSD
jgi:hypothetical protein